jgi:hypothetical protein
METSECYSDLKRRSTEIDNLTDFCAAVCIYSFAVGTSLPGGSGLSLQHVGSQITLDFTVVC